MDPFELQTAVVDFVNQPNYQPVKPRVIAHRLGLPKEEAADVRRAVKRLVREEPNWSIRQTISCVPAITKKPSPRPLSRKRAAKKPSPPAPLPQAGEGRKCRTHAIGQLTTDLDTKRRESANAANMPDRKSSASSTARKKASASCGRRPAS